MCRAVLLDLKSCCCKPVFIFLWHLTKNLFLSNSVLFYYVRLTRFISFESIVSYQFIKHNFSSTTDSLVVMLDTNSEQVVGSFILAQATQDLDISLVQSSTSSVKVIKRERWNCVIWLITVCIRKNTHERYKFLCVARTCLWHNP